MLLSKVIYIAFKLHILSVCTFPKCSLNSFNQYFFIIIIIIIYLLSSLQRVCFSVGFCGL